MFQAISGSVFGVPSNLLLRNRTSGGRQLVLWEVLRLLVWDSGQCIWVPGAVLRENFALNDSFLELFQAKDIVRFDFILHSCSE